MFFDWLTRRTRAAILAGFEQAAEEIDGTPETTGTLERLKERLALPAPSTEEKTTRKTKAN